ncbi:phosphoadenosine phosphosulfate reductase family protein [Vibrio sp. PID17_43]|uniref:phosphoadenosine phosphosulfate reductase domain-containing protein n=1 Tax=Vibrio sp. PID17_43 TaxID=1583451 RepID=UPI000BFFAA0E|nr:phosphoadenosine phosphosulfate reductase family protein [Vibrio sp. PID17_43]PHJ42771.1 hypothetical protein AK965_05175 [Vibrio sp. PID17_43]
MSEQGKVKHVLKLSGDKNSAALAIYVARKFPEMDIDYFFTDTGKELPEVYEYLDQLEIVLGKPILQINDRKDFDYWLMQHNNVLPSNERRWCTIRMKLEPFEKWIKPYLDDGYKIVSYVGVRADELWRDSFRLNDSHKYLEIKMPFVDDGKDEQDIIDILDRIGLGLPKFYEWRSGSGCTFCFFQQKIEWVQLMERYPEAFEEAKYYEKKAQNSDNGEAFFWMDSNEPLESLEDPARIAQIKANHKKVQERDRKSKRWLGICAHARLDESIPINVNEWNGSVIIDTECFK